MGMWRRLAAMGVAVAVLATVGVAGAKSAPRQFRAILSGANEVQVVETQGWGKATFKVSKDGESIRYKLAAADLNSAVTMSHIHAGEAGQNGPVVVWLFPSAPPASPGVEADGRLADGEFTAADLRGVYAGKWEEFKQDLMSGKLYVNLHTTTSPAGEIRGQIGPKGHGADDTHADDHGGHHEAEAGDDHGHHDGNHH